MKLKYTKELLEPLVRDSVSISEVIRRLGLKWAGGTHSYILHKIKLFNLDTSHFLGQASNRGISHRGGPEKLHWTVILVYNRLGRKDRTIVLRRALIESGIPYVCGCCGLLPEWCGRPLILEIDHINGDHLDNRPDNLRFICPNCHSQTPTFCRKR